MAGKLFGVICLLSVGYGIVSGRGEALAGAIFDGAGSAVELVLFLCGTMALWNGVLSVLKEAGAVAILSKLLSPVLRLIFPRLSEYEDGDDIREDVSCCLAANLLGIGNAATPFALSALAKLQKENPTPERPTSEMVTLTVLNTAPFCILPATVFALRQEAGSTEPFSVLLPIAIASFATALFGLLLTGIAGRVEERLKRSPERERVRA